MATSTAPRDGTASYLVECSVSRLHDRDPSAFGSDRTRDSLADLAQLAGLGAGESIEDEVMHGAHVPGGRLVELREAFVFPVDAGQTGDDPIFAGGADFDLDLLETRTLDGRTQELVYRPTLRTWPTG